MDYRKYGETYYIRLDRGDEIIGQILDICRKENIKSATFSGIGGCGNAEVQSFIPETGTFELRELNGMLELVSLTGNVITDDSGEYYHHTHALFAFKNGEEHCTVAGHMKSITVSYTAEIELHPVIGGTIRRKYNVETGTGFWNFGGDSMNLSFYKSIIDQDRVAVVVCNLEHEIIYMNPAAINYYGKRGGDKLIGSSILSCHNQESSEKIKQVVEWFAADESHNIVYTFHNDKQNKDVYMVALRNSGKLIGYYEKHEYRNPETMQMYDLYQ